MGFIAQLVEHRTGNREVTGSNPVEVLNFFQASLRNCINCVHCDDHFFIFIFRNIHYVHINGMLVGVRIFQRLYLSLSVSIPDLLRSKLQNAYLYETALSPRFLRFQTARL